VSSAGKSSDHPSLIPCEVEQRHRASLAGHHPADSPQRRPSHLDRRLRGENRLIHVVQHGQPVGRAAELILGALPLGYVRHHPHRSHQGPILA
jgi:hypothetical protein